MGLGFPNSPLPALPIDMDQAKNMSLRPYWEYFEKGFWHRYDDFTQELIEIAYLNGAADVVMNHGRFQDDDVTLLLKGVMIETNNKHPEIYHHVRRMDPTESSKVDSPNSPNRRELSCEIIS
jgi:hypothetical protein